MEGINYPTRFNGSQEVPCSNPSAERALPGEKLPGDEVFLTALWKGSHSSEPSEHPFYLWCPAEAAPVPSGWLHRVYSLLGQANLNLSPPHNENGHSLPLTDLLFAATELCLTLLTLLTCGAEPGEQDQVTGPWLRESRGEMHPALGFLNPTDPRQRAPFSHTDLDPVLGILWKER